jgi:hypothetical protein
MLLGFEHNFENSLSGTAKYWDPCVNKVMSISHNLIEIKNFYRAELQLKRLHAASWSANALS